MRFRRCIANIASLDWWLTTIVNNCKRWLIVSKTLQNNRSQWLSWHNYTDGDGDLENHRILRWFFCQKAEKALPEYLEHNYFITDFRMNSIIILSWPLQLGGNFAGLCGICKCGSKIIQLLPPQLGGNLARAWVEYVNVSSHQHLPQSWTVSSDQWIHLFDLSLCCWKGGNLDVLLLFSTVHFIFTSRLSSQFYVVTIKAFFYFSLLCISYSGGNLVEYVSV